jgi:predicted metalloprotease
VLAHEIGHHVQTVLGTERESRSAVILMQATSKKDSARRPRWGLKGVRYLCTAVNVAAYLRARPHVMFEVHG